MEDVHLIIRKKRSSLDVVALQAFARRAYKASGLKGSVSVLLTGDLEMRKLNRTFRRKDTATDVLSFPGAALGMDGDIAISADIAARNGTALGHGLQQEIQILLLHGMLHLAGYDHEVDSGQMSRKEELLRGRLGLPGTLILRVQQGRKLLVKRKPGSARKKTTR